MRCERLTLDGRDGDPAAAVACIRALVPQGASVAAAVRDIIARVRAEGDAGLRDLTRRLDTAGADPPSLHVPRAELEDALSALDSAVRAGLEVAIANVRAVAAAGMGEDREVLLPQGQRVRLRELPVGRAAVYVPGGRAPYPSTVVMGAVTAQVAGVAHVAVCAPPGADGDAHPAILAACALCGVDDVLRAGGAQAIAALAYGTESVQPADVIVGPGNLYVQEAKRQVFGDVGIDSLAGPSDVLIVLGAGAEVGLVALDLLAQAEHGPESPVVAVGADAGVLDALAGELARLAPTRPSARAAVCALVQAPDLDAALTFADAFAPEHLQLVGGDAEALAPRVRAAGCLFLGAESGTAFGDYVAGSNHVLPTAGSARFASALSPQTFRRRMAEVRLGPAAAALAAPGAAVARAEGFVVHAESMEARIGENGRP